MRASLVVSLLLAACGSAPAATCRSNADCSLDRVCVAGACGTVGVDAGVRDAFVGGDSGSTTSDAGVDASQEGPPPGESCANPILLAPVSEGGGIPVAVWNGELGDYANDAFPDCSGPEIAAPDIVFEIQRPMDVRDIVITTSPADLDTILAVDDSCDGRFAWACNDDRNQDAGGARDLSSAIFLWHFSPERAAQLYLIVDGGRSTVTGGRVSVRVEVRPPASLDCSAPLDISGGGTVLAFPPVDVPNEGDCMGTPVEGDALFRISDGTAPPGRITTESSDFPVSLRLVDTECAAVSTLCAPTMGDASYHHTELGPVMVEGLGFVAVEGIGRSTDGSFWVDYDP